MSEASGSKSCEKRSHTAANGAGSNLAGPGCENSRIRRFSASGVCSAGEKYPPENGKRPPWSVGGLYAFNGMRAIRLASCPISTLADAQALVTPLRNLYFIVSHKVVVFRSVLPNQSLKPRIEERFRTAPPAAECAALSIARMASGTSRSFDMCA